MTDHTHTCINQYSVAYLNFICYHSNIINLKLLWMSVCVWMYVCVCVCGFTYVWCVGAYVRMCVDVSVGMRVIRACVCAYACACPCVCACMCVRVCLFTIILWQIKLDRKIIKWTFTLFLIVPQTKYRDQI